MKKIFLLLAICVFCSTTIKAQDYKQALGLRMGPYYGITYKHFLNETRAIEGILHRGQGGLGLTGLYEIHTTAFDLSNLKAYGGIGAGIFFHRDQYNHDNGWGNNDQHRDRNNNFRATVGVDLILGAEYTIPKLPFNISADWKPSINIIGDAGAYWNQLAVSLRFVF